MSDTCMVLLRQAAAAQFARRIGVTVVLATILGGCVPLPYKPAATVTHVPVKADEASAIIVRSEPRRELLASLAHSIQRAESRVVVVDSNSYLSKVLTGDGRTLSDVLAASHDNSSSQAADYLLCVGAPSYRKLHDTGFAAPFPYFPVFWVGYEKVQSRESLPASFVNLRDPQGADGLIVTSAYSEVIAGFAYGVATVARPEAALREALARDVAHTLAAAQPSGVIRLVLLTQEGGTLEANPESTPAPPQVAASDNPVDVSAAR